MSAQSLSAFKTARSLEVFGFFFVVVAVQAEKNKTVSQSSVLHNNTLPLTLANCRCYSTGFMKRQELKPCMVISRGGNNHSGVKFRSTALMMLSTPPHLQPEEVFWNPSSLSALSLHFVLYSIARSVWHT